MTLAVSDAVVDGRQLAEAWFPFFVEHARERGAELAEMMTDCAREELLNSHTARHLRAFGRRRWPHFWARCEWEDVDLCFGRAGAPFTWTPTAWNEQWDRSATGGLGIIEAKLVYGHATPAARAAQIERMADQLAATVTKNAPRSVGATLGMVWWLSYADEPPSGLGDALARSKFAPIAGDFAEVGRVNTRDIWPIENGGPARLDVGLFLWNGQT